MRKLLVQLVLYRGWENPKEKWIILAKWEGVAIRLAWAATKKRAMKTANQIQRHLSKKLLVRERTLEVIWEGIQDLVLE